jgi:peptidoglycan/xylan/chitin deacetylase (PgdA/CDA1 family)
MFMFQQAAAATAPIVVLGYHRLENSGNTVATSPRLFAAHMRWLLEHGFAPLDRAAFETALGGTAPAGKRFLLTFDDGYESVLRHGLPILRDFGIPAINFIITGVVGHAGYLSWKQAAALQESGIVANQSHSHTHSVWTSRDEMQRDIAASRSALANHLGLAEGEIKHLTWPWGRCRAGWADAALAEGFSHQYLVSPQGVTGQTSPQAIPRICCDGYPLARFAVMMRLLAAPLGNLGITLARRILKGNQSHAA